MREIKFRAWDKEQKIMLPENTLKILMWGDGSYTVRDWYKENRGEYTYEGEGSDDCVLMQYTGLKDKNGKEIYERDIVQEGIRRWEVKWISVEDDWDYTGWLMEEMYGDNYCHSEVIGNIYENPELSEGVN